MAGAPVRWGGSHGTGAGPHDVAAWPAADMLVHGCGGSGQGWPSVVAPVPPVAPAVPHISHTGGGGEHWDGVVPVACVCSQHAHVAARPATASGCGQGGGGAHDTVPVAPVAPVQRSRTNAQMQPGIVPVVPDEPLELLEPAEPAAGHGLQRIEAAAPRLKMRVTPVIGHGHGPHANSARAG